MQTKKKDFKSIVLSEKERDESNIFVCYERTQYHFFKRNHGVEKFIWLFADRVYGFNYSDGNEPIFPKYNGLIKLLDAIQETFHIDSVELKSMMREKFEENYKAHAMLRTYRADGSFYNTSNLFEGFVDDTVYYTKTNETMFETCLPLSFKEFVQRFPKNNEGKMEINFIKAPDIFFMDLKKTGIELFREIMKNKYGYYVDNDNVYDANNELVNKTTEGLELLIDYFSNTEEILAGGELSKKVQLRMYKHITNKIQPITECWKSIVRDKECLEYLDTTIREKILSTIEAIESDLKNLTKWSSVVNIKTEEKYLLSYIKYLKILADDFSEFQDASIIAIKELLRE